MRICIKGVESRNTVKSLRLFSNESYSSHSFSTFEIGMHTALWKALRMLSMIFCFS